MGWNAHTGEDGVDQPLLDHLQKTAGMCRRFAEAFQAGAWGECCGLLHDVGKISKEFQDYLKTGKGRVDHSTAGAQLAAGRYGAAGKILAYIAAGHHAGLPDHGGAPTDSGTLEARLAKAVPDFSDWERLVSLPKALPRPPLSPPLPEPGFAAAFFIRMLFSCLTDADYLDTEAFCDPDASAMRVCRPTLEDLAPKLDKHLETLAAEAAPTPINARRREILGHCRNAASETPGVFSLTVPTGGGKTLSSMAFALDHAGAHDKRRVIYVIPFTSIIEQNARVFRDVFGDEAVLEHHCNFTHPGERVDFGADEKPDADAARQARLATQNWDAPVIATTAVQFFESLFAGRSSRCRKLHNIANSVVVLDEAQMLPPNLLAPTVLALRELVRNYGVTVVLCTATQPALMESRSLTTGFPEEEVREIIPEDRLLPLFDAFRRVRITFEDTPLSNADVAGRLRSERQALCIVNTRREAQDIFTALGRDASHFHLSARMYPAHRRRVLERIRKRLDKGEPCRVVSTSLVEAGVDVDFPMVMRALAGLDSIAQAAGRCNRNGKNATLGHVFVFLPESGLPKAPFFSRRAAVTELVTKNHDDLLSPAAVREFFTTLYLHEDLDAKGILGMINKRAKTLAFPFREIDAAYRFIENDMETVIIERDEDASKLIKELEFAKYPSSALRRLQAHSVQVYRQELAALSPVLRRVRDQYWIAEGGAGYRDDIGLFPEDPTYREPEENVL